MLNGMKFTTITKIDVENQPQWPCVNYFPGETRETFPHGFCAFTFLTLSWSLDVGGKQPGTAAWCEARVPWKASGASGHGAAAAAGTATGKQQMVVDMYKSAQITPSEYDILYNYIYIMMWFLIYMQLYMYVYYMYRIICVHIYSLSMINFGCIYIYIYITWNDLNLYLTS